MMLSPTLASVVIPTYNRPDRLRSCLASLAVQSEDTTRWEVVVVNDGGSDVTDVVDAFRGRFRVRLISQDQSGPATARNKGAEAAEGGIIAFLDDDCVAEADWVKNIIATAKPGELVGGKVVNLLSGNLYSETCQTLIDFLYERLEGTTDMFFTSNNMCIHASDFHRIGGFDTGFRTSAGEDRELCVRAVQSGMALRFDPGIRIGHTHDLQLSSYIRLHFKYGRASDTYRKSIARLEIKDRKNAGHGFYLDLLLHPFRKRLKRPLMQSMLLGISQAGTLSGFLYERFLARRLPRLSLLFVVFLVRVDVPDAFLPLPA